MWGRFRGGGQYPTEEENHYFIHLLSDNKSQNTMLITHLQGKPSVNNDIHTRNRLRRRQQTHLIRNIFGRRKPLQRVSFLRDLELLFGKLSTPVLLIVSRRLYLV